MRGRGDISDVQRCRAQARSLTSIMVEDGEWRSPEMVIRSAFAAMGKDWQRDPHVATGV
jgi:hypothetical protein